MDLSTHFSGIGTAELAVAQLQVASLEVFGRSLSLCVTSACESAPGCQSALKQSLNTDACILKDILARCPVAGKLFASARSLGHLDQSVEEVWRVLRQSGCADTAGSCHQHGGEDCRTPRSMGDIAGSPCQLWSFFGKRLATTSHLIILLLTWALWVRWAAPLFLLHENVVGFDVGFLEWLLGDLYCVVALRADPWQVGLHFARRPRIYVTLWLISKIEAVADITDTYSKVVAAFAREFPCKFPLSSVFVATEDDVQSEYDAAKGRKQKKRQRLDEEVRPSGSGKFEALLTAKQQGYLKIYEYKWKLLHTQAPNEDASCLFDLSQNPEKKPRQSRGGMAPTVLKKSHRLWSPFLGRWLLKKELAVMLGFPTTNDFAKEAGIGNPIHVTSVGQIGIHRSGPSS